MGWVGLSVTCLVWQAQNRGPHAVLVILGHKKELWTISQSSTKEIRNSTATVCGENRNLQHRGIVWDLQIRKSEKTLVLFILVSVKEIIIDKSELASHIGSFSEILKVSLGPVWPQMTINPEWWML